MLKRAASFLRNRYATLGFDIDESDSYFVSNWDHVIYLCDSSAKTYKFLSDNIEIIKRKRYTIVIAGGGGDILYCHRIARLIRECYIPIHVEWCRSAGCNYAFIEHCTTSPGLLLDTHGRGDMVPREDMPEIIKDHRDWMRQFNLAYHYVPYLKFVDWQCDILLGRWDSDKTSDLREYWFTMPLSVFRTAHEITLDDLITFRCRTN